MENATAAQIATTTHILSGRALCAIRVRHGMMQREIARACGVSQAVITRAELGRHKTPQPAAKLAKYAAAAGGDKATLDAVASLTAEGLRGIGITITDDLSVYAEFLPAALTTVDRYVDIAWGILHDDDAEDSAEDDEDQHVSDELA